jgi:hypothetical protein
MMPVSGIAGVSMCDVMTIGAVATALCLPAPVSAQAEPSAVDRPIIVSQAGFTLGSRDDLGPRYDPYSERWDQYKPTGTHACRWVAVRTPAPSGRMVIRRQRLCGFRVPARQ